MGSPTTIESSDYIILFDGVCNLCSHAVQFIIHRDKKSKFKFASLQSSYGAQKLKEFGFDSSKLHSIILLKDEKVYQRSSAALEIAKHLSGLWPLFYAFKIVPGFIRDAAYNFIARNRYKFFGKMDECWIPTPALQSRFLD